MPQFDRYDLLILNEIQNDSSQPTAEIAEKVGLSLSPCWRRIKRMRDSGVIKKDVALLDRKVIGLEIEAVVSISLRNQHRDDRDSFQEWAQKCPEIVECLSISGERDYLMRVLVPDLTAYEHFLASELLAQPCVNSASSSFVLKEIKKTTALPLPRK